MAERKEITVRATRRDGRGKNDARRARRDGLVPVTVYGGEGEAVAAVASAQALVSGEVKKIDKPAGRITLKHAEIKAYDMPGMTGAYKVQDASMLDKVQVGDHVQFQLDRVNSVYTITKIDVQK